jgi:hypothetical protein
VEKEMAETPSQPNKPEVTQETELENDAVDIKNFESTGVTTITERRVVVGTDGRRRLLTRRRIVHSEPEEKE